MTLRLLKASGIFIAVLAVLIFVGRALNISSARRHGNKANAVESPRSKVSDPHALVPENKTPAPRPASRLESSPNPVAKDTSAGPITRVQAAQSKSLETNGELQPTELGSHLVGAKLVRVSREDYIKTLEAKDASDDLIQAAKLLSGDLTVIKTDPDVAQIPSSEIQVQGCNLGTVIRGPTAISVNSDGKIVAAQSFSQSTSNSSELSELVSRCHIVSNKNASGSFVTVLTPPDE